MSTDSSPHNKILRALLRSLVRFCAKHAFKIQEVFDCLREEFLRHSQTLLEEAGEKITQSRLSIMTGISRREVEKALQGKLPAQSPPSTLARVISRWRDDPRFCTSAGVPKNLTIDPERGEFRKLVASVSKDIGPATLLFELERLRFVEKIEQGKKEATVKLLVDNYIPRGAAKVDEISEILSQDQSDLLNTVQYNIFEGQTKPQHHLRTTYDKIRPEGVDHLRAWFLREGHALHLRAREEISKFDQDVNPKSDFKGPTVKVGFSSFATLEKSKDEDKK